MIYSLKGTLLEKSTDLAVIECGGGGDSFSCSNNTLSMLPAAGENAFVYTVLSVKENGVDLYGFSTQKERDAFRLLCSISGVGPKLALSVLSTYDADRLALLIASGDAKAVTACPGVGPRLAQRIVNELKDKVLQLDITGIEDPRACLPTVPESSTSSWRTETRSPKARRWLSTIRIPPLP